VTISLTNTSGRCQIFVLTHETYCEALGTCACNVGVGRGARRTASSLTLVSGATSPELPDAVFAVPEIVRAVRRGELRVQRRVEEPPTSAAPAPTAPVKPEASRRPDEPRTKKKRGTA
jgi:hypothetical protein